MNSPPLRTCVIRFEKVFGKDCAGKSVRTPPECRTLALRTDPRSARGTRAYLVRLTPDDRFDLVANLFDESGFAGFDVQTQERFGV